MASVEVYINEPILPDLVLPDELLVATNINCYDKDAHFYSWHKAEGFELCKAKLVFLCAQLLITLLMS